MRKWMNLRSGLTLAALLVIIAVRFTTPSRFRGGKRLRNHRQGGDRRWDLAAV